MGKWILKRPAAKPAMISGAACSAVISAGIVHAFCAVSRVASRLTGRTTWRYVIRSRTRLICRASEPCIDAQSSRSDSLSGMVSNGFSDAAEAVGVGNNSISGVDENDETVIGLVNKMINDAVRVGVSDIYFETFYAAQ